MSDSHTKQPVHVRHRHALIEAATAAPRESPHEVDDSPSVFEFTPEQVTLLRSLAYLTDFQIAHTHRASPDVAASFDAAAMHTIQATPELGGAARAEQIRTLVARHTALADIAAILAPLATLVGQNILATDGALATHVGEVLGIAHRLNRSHPNLATQLAAPDRWSHAHHSSGPAPRAAAPAPAATIQADRPTT